MGSLGVPEIRTKDRMPLWQSIAERVQAKRSTAIAQWSKKIIGTSIPNLPSDKTVSVREWAVHSGHLTPDQITITSSVPSKILKMIATGAWSAEEVFIAFSIRATMAHHLTNPFADVFFEDGLARARELDLYFQTTGHTIGPLHGLPISLKDVMRLKNRPTTLGFTALADNKPAESDDVVTHLYDAGAVFFCKTTVPQSLMSGECNSVIFGRTSTPDNRGLSAGGSSGGEGSLIALRGSPLGIGTDIAGSIRTPANYNGIYGLCPSYGRLPSRSPQDTVLNPINGVAGPLCSSIDGLELYLRTVLSFEPWKWDATCVPLPWSVEKYDEIKRLAAKGELCFGIISHDAVVRPHPPIERVLSETKAALIKAGHQVVDLDFFRPDDDMWNLALRIFCSDGGQSLQQGLASTGEPRLKETMIADSSMALTAAQLKVESSNIIRLRQEFLLKWQQTARVTPTGRPVDVVIFPSGGHVAAPHSTMDYFLYEAISNILNWTCATIPIDNVDRHLDPAPGSDANFVPMSDADLSNWQKYSPEAYENGAICLQVMAPTFSEERVLASMRIIDEALGRGPEYMR